MPFQSKLRSKDETMVGRVVHNPPRASLNPTSFNEAGCGEPALPKFQPSVPNPPTSSRLRAFAEKIRCELLVASNA